MAHLFRKRASSRPAQAGGSQASSHDDSRTSRGVTPRSSRSRALDLDTGSRSPSTYVAKLWGWAAEANRARLANITLAHVLAGDTCPPIALSDFEAFLAFCDISLENLQFIVWFQDYRSRFEKLSQEEQARSPAPARPCHVPSVACTGGPDGTLMPIVTNTNASSSSGTTSMGTSSSKKVKEVCPVEVVELTPLPGAVCKPSPPGLKLNIAVSKSRASGTQAISDTTYLPPPTPTSPAPEYTPEASTDGPQPFKMNEAPELDLDAFYTYAATTASVPSDLLGGPATLSSSQDAAYALIASSSRSAPPSPVLHTLSSKASLQPGSPRTSTNPSIQPFRSEIQNVLATFLVPGSKKELLLAGGMRDQAITEAGWTTHPDVFLPLYEAIYDLVESVSLRRFLLQASTNINRPKQLFWYYSTLPTLLLALAISFFMVMSTSQRLIVPPQSHRAWRLFPVILVMLGSMQWYAGYRGFCSMLFLRSATQLRTWELEAMSDDEEAQAYFAALTSEKGKTENDAPGSVPPTPMSATSPISPIERIAPFLDEVEDVPAGKAVQAAEPQSGKGNPQFRGSSSGARGSPRGFRRPPIFGPDRVVEDARIRAVHVRVFWELALFGIIWGMLFGAIILSVPTWHVI